MNRPRHVELFSDKLNLANSWMHDLYAKRCPLPPLKSCDKFSAKSEFKVLKWPGNNPDFNPIKNLWTEINDKVAEKQSSSDKELIGVKI